MSVTQELSKVREQIERIDAQLKNLQNQVAYSTIILNLEAAVVNSSPEPHIYYYCVHRIMMTNASYLA